MLNQLNADILSLYRSFGADEVIDLAAAVQDPTQHSQVNPAYLSAGMPNNGYHDAIAQHIADAVTRFPPDARL